MKVLQSHKNSLIQKKECLKLLLFTMQQQLCVQYAFKIHHHGMSTNFTVLSKVLFLWLYGLYFEINTAAVLICGCHWTSSNTGCHSHVAQASPAPQVSLAGNTSCWWPCHNRTTQPSHNESFQVLWIAPCLKAYCWHTMHLSLMRKTTWLSPGVVACSSCQCLHSAMGGMDLAF